MNISLQKFCRYGQKSGVKSKKTIKRIYTEGEYKNIYSRPCAISFCFHYFSHVLFIVADTSCDTIAKLRRKLQRVSENKIIFLDETHIKIKEVPRAALVVPD